MPEEIAEPQITQKPIETPEVAAEIQPVEEKPTKPWLKIVLFSILGLVLSVGLVFAGYKLGQKQIQPGPQPTPTPIVEATPTPDTTADWKTYTNTKYGYSIKYPKDWKVWEENNAQGVGIEGSYNTPSYAPLKISVQDNPEKLSIREWFRKTFKNPEPTVARFIDITIDGQPAVKWPDEILYVLSFYVAKSDKVFTFSPIDVQTPDKVENQNKMMELMLSTFKFTSEEAGGEKVYCKDPRPEICTMECIANPPYICGSDEKSYCSECQACAKPEVDWYVTQNEPCGAE